MIKNQCRSIQPSTYVGLLRSRADNQPQQVAFTFLVDDTKTICITYAELDRRARAVAAQLQMIGAAGQRALLLYPPGLEYIVAFLGCLYADVVAVPAYPPHSANQDRTLPRLRAMTKDSQAFVALTTSAILPIGQSLASQDPVFQNLHWLVPDTLEAGTELEWQEPELSSQTLAFLQYTSGSTATPKGVKLTHGNLLHNSALIQQCFGHTAESQGVIWLPPYHDMGLIGGILQPLYIGFPTTLMSPVSFLQRPLRWLQAISDYQATTSGGPNFAYDLCARKITPEQRATLDLSSWKVAFNGAEPIHAKTMAVFAETFKECGFRREAFYPCYGLAEATLIVSGGLPVEPPIVRTFEGSALDHHRVVVTGEEHQGNRELVGCGRELLDQEIVIVHPEEQTRCGSGQVGEIWVAGPSVAQGYWNRVDETKQVFHAYIRNTNEGPFLRTGDLGFIDDGELFVTGRLKDLIIIHGRNHYPQDIERTVERCHIALRPSGSAAFTIDVDGEERLVIVQEVERQHRQVDVEVVATAIRQAVAEEHELVVQTVVLLKPGGVPKTSSGKVQRRLCREWFLTDQLKFIGKSGTGMAAAPSAVEILSRETVLALAPEARTARLSTYLQEQIARMLGTLPSQISGDQPINALGLDSLAAIELQHLIEQHFGVDIPMVSFLRQMTITQVAAEISEQIDTADTPAIALSAAAPATSTLPLSVGQQSLWFLHQVAPSSAAYHIARTVHINGPLDPAALQRAFQRLVDRHPSLRTTFGSSGAAAKGPQPGVPAQLIADQGTIDFHIEDAGDTPSYLQARLQAEVHRPFDLQHMPLMRVRLFVQSDTDHVLLLVLHHIIADFWSLAILTQELRACYRAERSGHAPLLPPLLHDYSDYTRWQADMLAGASGTQLWSYWQEQLADAQMILELPTERARPPIQTYRGATHTFTLDEKLTQQIKTLAQGAGATVYVTLLSAFQVLLYRYSGQDDFLVGSPTAGRSRSEWANVVGYMVNPVVLRADLRENPSFSLFLAQTQQRVLDAFAHQDYPFALLVEQLQPARDPSRAPLFQVMFVFQKAHLLHDIGLTGFALEVDGAQMTWDDLTIELIKLDQQTSQLDLTLMMAEVGGVFAGSLQYNTDLFDSGTIERMAEHLVTLLRGIIAQPQQRVAELPLLTDLEQQRLLRDWNATAVSYAHDRCMHHLFEEQAKRTPDAIAVIAGSEQLSYRELNTRANQVAHHLQQQGVGLEVFVGIAVDRSLTMLIGLLGILKAGAAYVPIDLHYPQERIAFILKDTAMAFLLTQEQWLAQLPDHSARTICLDTDWPSLAQAATTNPQTSTRPDNLAYVIYTSGSTGRPKGVAIAHASAVAMLDWAQQTFSPAQLACVLASTSICFDLSIFELFLPLSMGGTVIMAENALELPRLPAAANVTLVNTVPSAMAELVRLGAVPSSVTTVNLAGEPLPGSLVRQIYQETAIQQVFNLYGPSEDTTYSTYAEIHLEDSQAPSIGRPIHNTRAYVLDARLQPTAIGIPGELYLGGAGLARGYVNQSSLTAERFIPDMFSAIPGARLYKTGDLVRYSMDGSLQFLGRNDSQIKLRGFRIELSEIEAVLQQHPAVQESLVIVREDTPGDKRLVAYVVQDRDQPPIHDELQHLLEAKLPKYMLPSAIVFLTTFPRTPNGKIGRQALPAPERPTRPDDSFCAPSTPMEVTIAAIWLEVLGLDRVGVHDNFFELGGHSLLATQIIARLNDTFQLELPIHHLFETPTIAGLVQHIEMIRWATSTRVAVGTDDDEDREEGRL